jgi:hypothetical protein
MNENCSDIKQLTLMVTSMEEEDVFIDYSVLPLSLELLVTVLLNLFILFLCTFFPFSTEPAKFLQCCIGFFLHLLPAFLMVEFFHSVSTGNSLKEIQPRAMYI